MNYVNQRLVRPVTPDQPYQKQLQLAYQFAVLWLIFAFLLLCIFVSLPRCPLHLRFLHLRFLHLHFFAALLLCSFDSKYL